MPELGAGGFMSRSIRSRDSSPHGTCRLVGKTGINQIVTGMRARLQLSKCCEGNAAPKGVDRSMKRLWTGDGEGG